MKDCVVFDASCDDVGSGLNHSAEYRQIVGFSPPTGENNVLAAGTNQLCDTGVPGLNCASWIERDWTRRAYGTRKEVSA
jgi:hypothetical protein